MDQRLSALMQFSPLLRSTDEPKGSQPSKHSWGIRNVIRIHASYTLLASWYSRQCFLAGYTTHAAVDLPGTPMRLRDKRVYLNNIPELCSKNSKSFTSEFKTGRLMQGHGNFHASESKSHHLEPQKNDWTIELYWVTSWGQKNPRKTAARYSYRPPETSNVTNNSLALLSFFFNPQETILYYLVVSTTLKNMSSSVGIMKFPIYGKS